MLLKAEMRILLFIFSIIVLIFLLTGSFFAGFFFHKSRIKAPAITEITSQTILEHITENAFLVTKTVFINQSATITVDEGSGWSNFWWGKTIDANGLVRADVGVDYSKIATQDIKVDHLNQRIYITLPNAEILDVNVSGDIEVRSQSGVLKYLFDSDANRDHNLAMSKLIEQSSIAIEGNSELMNEARTNSIAVIQLVLDSTGYTVEIVEPE